MNVRIFILCMQNEFSAFLYFNNAKINQKHYDNYFDKNKKKTNK